jgi:pSer/pThr/pTyr-binding forkhead associated (FHA) protein
MARLILKSAVFAEGDIELTESDLPVTLGRSHRADITINDMLLSRIHAEICHGEHGGFEIVDHESTNLTIVNNQDIDRALLKSGDCLLLGETEILIEIDAPEVDSHEKTTRELPQVNPRKSVDPLPDTE